jgi:outer membrane protein assembly factor BamA
VPSTEPDRRLAGRFFLSIVGLLVCAAAPLTAQETLVVRKLAFEGNKAIDDVTLAAAIQTTGSSWFATFPVIRWVGLGEKRRLNEKDLERDVERLHLLYRINGYLEVKVDTLIHRTDKDAYITFRIVEGPPIRVVRLDIVGLDSLPKEARITRDLPLRVGDAFSRSLLRVAADTLTNRLRDRGYPAAAVFLAKRQVDSAAQRAELDLTVETGPKAAIGQVDIEGVGSRDSAFVLSLLATHSGRSFNQSELLRSQRNIASSDLYRFASVEIDTARMGASLDSVPLLIRLVPSAKHKVSTAAGYGTDDCFRTEAGYTIRNPWGVGRVLEFAGRLSKIGVGAPLDWGFENGFPCSRLKADSIGSSKLNYSASVALRRPAFLSPDNNLAVAVFAERRSEFAVYSRQEIGGNIVLVHQTAKRIPVTLGYRLSYGSTDANDVNFCAYFNACNAEDIAVLKQPMRQGVISLGVARLRVNNLLDPTRGSTIGFQVSQSGKLTLSEELQRFTSLGGDAALYYPVTSSVTAAFRVRGGMLFSPPIDLSTSSFRYVPPEQRFYAGGPNDVRGYDRNELGPVVYVVLDTTLAPDTTNGGASYDPASVQISPTGGDRTLIANLELRFPSPIFTSRMRLVAFVDGGSVWAQSSHEPVLFRITPGAGLRIATPLGPARFDVAYNGYGYPAGALYASLPDGTLIIVASNYVKPRSPGFTFHFAIGQAF